MLFSIPFTTTFKVHYALKLLTISLPFTIYSHWYAKEQLHSSGYIKRITLLATSPPQIF